MRGSNGRKALISGASIAGPTVGYWLARNGWAVTIVERAAAPRSGGYPIDLRGSAVEVAKRMGIYDEVRRAKVGARSFEVLNPKGRRLAKVDLTADLINDDELGDVELPRGELVRILLELTSDTVNYVFNDSVVAISCEVDRVDVVFEGGGSGSFDVVIGADGIHSTTRRLVFGPESEFLHHLGPMVAVWDMVDASAAPGSGTIFNLPGRVASQMTDDAGVTRGFFAAVVDDPAEVDLGDPVSPARLARDAFAGHDIPLVDALIADVESADDVYFDTVSQVRMQTWHQGRVALVGDSAFCPSFLSGQGTSVALVGAFVLASELVANPDPEQAFVAYEAKLREFIDRNQALALSGRSTVLPRDAASLRKRNVMFWMFPWIKRLGLLKLLKKRAGGVGDVSTSIPIDGYGLA